MPTATQINIDKENEISNCYWVNNGVVTSDAEFTTWDIMTLWEQILYWIYLFYKGTCYSMEYTLCITHVLLVLHDVKFNT